MASLSLEGHRRVRCRKAAAAGLDPVCTVSQEAFDPGDKPWFDAISWHLTAEEPVVYRFRRLGGSHHAIVNCKGHFPDQASSMLMKIS